LEFCLKYRVARFLISNGAQIDPKNKEKSSPIHLAYQKGPNKITELLIESGNDIE